MDHLTQLIKQHLKTHNINLTPNHQTENNTYNIHHWPHNQEWKIATIQITNQTTTLWKTAHPISQTQKTTINNNDPQLLNKITQWTQQHLTGPATKPSTTT